MSNPRKAFEEAVTREAFMAGVDWNRVQKTFNAMMHEAINGKKHAKEGVEQDVLYDLSYIAWGLKEAAKQLDMGSSERHADALYKQLTRDAQSAGE